MKDSYRKPVSVVLMFILTVAGAVESYAAAQHFMNSELWQGFGAFIIAIVCGQAIIRILGKME